MRSSKLRHQVREGRRVPDERPGGTVRRLRGHDQLPKVILGVKSNNGIEVVKSQAQAAAA